MSPELYEYLPIIIGAIIGAIIGYLVVKRLNRRAAVVRDENSGKDVLDEGASPAQRNKALIDAPKAVEDSFGQTSANANSDQVAAAGAEADAEAGGKVTPTVMAETAGAAKRGPEPGSSTQNSGDDLTRIKGLGPKLAAILGEQGVTSFAQIAAWSDADVERVDASLGRFSGRITRDQWVEQAKLLAAGEESGFAEKFGQNG